MERQDKTLLQPPTTRSQSESRMNGSKSKKASTPRLDGEEREHANAGLWGPLNVVADVVYPKKAEAEEPQAPPVVRLSPSTGTVHAVPEVSESPLTLTGENGAKSGRSRLSVSTQKFFYPLLCSSVKNLISETVLLHLLYVLTA